MRPFSGSYESSCNSSAAYPYDDEGGALSPREADDLARVAAGLAVNRKEKREIEKAEKQTN